MQFIKVCILLINISLPRASVEHQNNKNVKSQHLSEPAPSFLLTVNNHLPHPGTTTDIYRHHENNTTTSLPTILQQSRSNHILHMFEFIKKINKNTEKHKNTKLTLLYLCLLLISQSPDINPTPTRDHHLMKQNMIADSVMRK